MTLCFCQYNDAKLQKQNITQDQLPTLDVREKLYKYLCGMLKIHKLYLNLYTKDVAFCVAILFGHLPLQPYILFLNLPNMDYCCLCSMYASKLPIVLMMIGLLLIIFVLTELKVRLTTNTIKEINNLLFPVLGSKGQRNQIIPGREIFRFNAYKNMR